ncbi:Hypothetical protein NTJ_00413 [Nesidiocoris tenuis]|nr:Hypothetical protein NTJ_00413 [Nesidiocoris tenuis]
MCEFLLFILRTFNFDARRVSSFVLVNNREYTDDVIYNHNVIIVHLDDKKYLVDIGFSQNSLREPVEFSFEETEEKSVTPIEKYLLECNDDHYKLNMWLKGVAWAPMYRFRRPIQYMDEKALAENYNAFMTAPRLIYIRDKIMKFGIVTKTGRIGCWCAFDSATRHGTPPYTLLVGENHEIPKSQHVTYEVFRDTIQKYVNIKLNDEYFDQEDENVA